VKDKVLRFYQQISAGLEKLPHKGHKKWAAYCGTEKTYYNLKNAVKRKFIKDWYKAHKGDLSFHEFVNLITLLYQAGVYEEVTLGGELLSLNQKFRQQINPTILSQWLDNLSGWAEIDNLCQSRFGGKLILSNWSSWKILFLKLASSENISKKRASLVLLTRPVREIRDERLKTLSFLLTNKHKHHKDILITKAISWLLREMIKNYRHEVADYLEKNLDSLPKIAIRETKRKLATGKK